MHWLHAGALPPGAIGASRLQRGGPLSTFNQPVNLQSPAGTQVSVYSGGGFTDPQDGGQLVGLLVGPVYRFKVTGVPNYESVEIYPTVELLDRLHPPRGKELRFALPVELTEEELAMAARGAFITRVIYVEDPDLALPTKSTGQSWFEAHPCDDPLVAADRLGRPIAILRIGSRFPTQPGGGQFTYGEPPVTMYHREAAAPVQAASALSQFTK